MILLYVIFLTSPEILCFFQYKCLPKKIHVCPPDFMYCLGIQRTILTKKKTRVVIAMNPNDLYAFFYHDYLCTSVNSTSDVWGFFVFKLGFCKCKWAFIVSLSYGNYICTKMFQSAQTGLVQKLLIQFY